MTFTCFVLQNIFRQSWICCCDLSARGHLRFQQQVPSASLISSAGWYYTFFVGCFRPAVRYMHSKGFPSSGKFFYQRVVCLGTEIWFFCFRLRQQAYWQLKPTCFGVGSLVPCLDRRSRLSWKKRPAGPLGRLSELCRASW